MLCRAISLGMPADGPPLTEPPLLQQSLGHARSLPRYADKRFLFGCCGHVLCSFLPRRLGDEVLTSAGAWALERRWLSEGRCPKPPIPKTPPQK